MFALNNAGTVWSSRKRMRFAICDPSERPNQLSDTVRFFPLLLVWFEWLDWSYRLKETKGNGRKDINLYVDRNRVFQLITGFWTDHIDWNSATFASWALYRADHKNHPLLVISNRPNRPLRHFIFVYLTFSMVKACDRVSDRIHN